METYGRSPDEILDDERIAIIDAVEIVEPALDCAAVRAMFPDWHPWTLDELLALDERQTDRVRRQAFYALYGQTQYHCKWCPRSLQRFRQAMDRLLAV